MLATLFIRGRVRGTPHRVGYSTIVGICLATVALAMSACGSDDEDPSRAPPSTASKLPTALAKAIPPPGSSERQVDDTFVAALPGSAAQVAVVVKGGEVIVYLCDGRKLGTWLGGKISDGRFDLRGSGLRVTGTVSGDQVEGTVTLADRKPRDFRAKRAEHGLGLYRRVREGAGKREALGWIVTREGLTGTDGKRGVAVSAETGPTGGTVGSEGQGGGGGSSETPVLSCEELQDKIDLALQAIEITERKVQTFSVIRGLNILKGRLADLLGQGCE